MRVPKRWSVIPFVFVAAALLVVVFVSSSRKNSLEAARANLLIASRRYPKFTREQRMAVLRELQLEQHPRWQNLSLAEMAERIAALALASTGTSQAPTAPFLGNLTAISAPNGDALDLFRQANCSLTMEWQSYTLSLPSLTYSTVSSTPSYDQVLHNEAGLTTTGGKWPAACGDPVLGTSALTMVPVGTTAGGQWVVAAPGFDALTSTQVIFTPAVNLAQGGTIQIGTISPSNASPEVVNTADLNGDGVGDLVAISTSAVTGGTATVDVVLGNPNGSFQSPVTYSLPGDSGLSLVIDDFNGDGKLDIVATSLTNTTAGQYTYSLSFLAGKGDGTFQTPQSVTLTAPTGVMGDPYFGLISADLLGNGKKDLVTSAGVVLIGAGDGTFTQSSTLAFTTSLGTSQWSPNVVAGDFNKDGKIDVAVDDGQSIEVYLGKGDGTFTPGNGYATIDNIGNLFATDLDGDGNLDLYSGSASGGEFQGDQFEFNQAYALMGNGNGKFVGAPYLPFVFTGTNMIDLNGDKILDGVGVNATINSTNVSFTSYLGNGDGTFKTGSTLQVSPITVSGNPVSFETLDSFGLGSTRGNGDVDLVYLPASFNWPGGVTGFLMATGNGDGSFNAPVFVQAPTFAPSGDFDQSESVSNLFVADVNGDGKADLIYSYSVEVYQTGVYEQGIAVQLSNGDGTFKAPQVIQTYSSTTPPGGAAPIVVQLGDATGSGKLDLFTETENVSTATVSLQLYLGNGDGTFGSALTPPVADDIAYPSFGSVLGQIVLADMNGDDKPDLVTLGAAKNGNGEIAISLGNGDGTFKTPNILDFGGSGTLGFGVSVADFNGDGKKDVEINGFNPPVDTGIFLGNGDGTLQAFTPSGGTAQPAEAIYLFGYGPALVTTFNGSSLPSVIAGQMVLINQASTTPTLIPTTTSLSPSATNITAGQNVTFTATVTASPTPTGTVTFLDGSTTLGTGTLNASGVATYSTTGLTVGTHSITASFPASSTYASSTSSAVTVTVTAPALIATTTKLTASATTVNVGTSVMFNATVTPASGSGTPTGTITFMDGSTALASMSLSGGAASYSTSSLAAGSHSITAVYGGDSNDSGSTSNALTVTVQALVPSFTLGASPSSGSVTAGASLQTTITATPVNGFNQQVSFACSGLSNGVTCSFSPQTVTPNGSTAASTTLTIGTTSQSALLARPANETLRRGAATLAFLGAGVLWFWRRRKNLTWPMVIVAGLLAFSAVVTGCGKSSTTTNTQQQSASYSVTVTATSGTLSQTTSYSLTVTQ